MVSSCNTCMYVCLADFSECGSDNADIPHTSVSPDSVSLFHCGTSYPCVTYHVSERREENIIYIIDHNSLIKLLYLSSLVVDTVHSDGKNNLS